MPKDDKERMIETVLSLGLDDQRQMLVMAMCQALFYSGVAESGKFILHVLRSETILDDIKEGKTTVVKEMEKFYGKETNN